MGSNSLNSITLFWKNLKLNSQQHGLQQQPKNLQICMGV
jgi:hypothetical protein